MFHGDETDNAQAINFEYTKRLAALIAQKKKYEDEISELSEINEVIQTKLSDLEVCNKRFFEEEEELKKQLSEVRKECAAAERNARIYKEEVDNLSAKYNREIETLKEKIVRINSTFSKVYENLLDACNSNCLFERTVSDLKGANAASSARIREMETILEGERARYQRELQNAEAELTRLREEMTQQMQKYKDLLDIKETLEFENSVNSMLMDAEENRKTASFSQSFQAGCSTPVQFRTVLRDKEQGNFSVSSSAKGDIEFKEVDAEGKFVKLLNRGSKATQIGGWQLVRRSGDNENKFKFHRTVKVGAGQTVTIWSMDSGAFHEPPTNIVMKEQRFFVSDNMSTHLLNPDGEELALHECKKRDFQQHISFQN